MKFIEGSERSSKDFLKFTDGQEVIGVCAGDLFNYKQHWINGKSEICPDDDSCSNCKTKAPAFRFRVNFIIKEGEGLVAKILEQGWNLYSDLRELHKEYDLQKHFIKITRRGTGMNDTSYSVIPVKNGTLPIEKLEIVAKVKLHDLTQKEQPQVNTPSPEINKGEELPF